MKRKIFSILFALVLALSLSLIPAMPTAAGDGEVTVHYGDITLPPGGGFFLQPDIWDLNAGDVTVSYTLDLSGAPNVAYTSNYGQSGYVGLIWPGSTWSGAWMSGFLCDWDNPGEEFPTYPDKDGAQDMDDKFNMQRSPNPGSWSETMYDVYCDTNTVAASPFGSGDNYGIWFDRDGVDQWQATMWGMVDGGTYNTSGVYDVEILYHKASAGKGTACPLFFPQLANPDAPSGYGIPTGFDQSSPGPGYDYFPTGISFDTDEAKMAMMQVFVSGNPGNGTIVVRDLTVTGCRAPVTLWAGQDIDVGNVTVTNDGDNLYVKYETTGDWMMTETHLHVAEDVGAIPQTEAKGKSTGGNPIPGHFDYKMEHDPPVADYLYTIPLDGWDAGTNLFIAAQAEVQKVNVITEAPYYAASVDDYWQGILNTGSPIPASWNRSNPAAVLALNGPLWFFSLGFGEPDNGWIIVEFDCPIRNGDGNDVQILEVTNASPYPSETADVYASQDGFIWILLGQADNSGQAYPVGLTASEFDLGSLPWAKYIKVVDTTDPIDHEGIASDAFDLEAVVSLQDCIEIMEQETAWAGTEVGQLPFDGKNWATYFQYTVAE